MEGLTQADIARRLGTTRLRDQPHPGRRPPQRPRRHHAQFGARELRGGRAAADPRLQAEGRRHRPDPEDEEQIPVILGRATANFVSHYLESNRIRGFGIGWGRTLREMTRHMRAGRYPDLCVNSMMGGLTRGLEINTFDIVSELARRLSSQCQYLAAPIYAGSPESRDTIMAQDMFRDAFRRIETDELAVLSVGDVTKRSMLVRYGLPEDVGIKELRAAGAVCDIIGQFIDDRGHPIDHPLNRRAIALPLHDLSRRTTVVFAAGGGVQGPRHRRRPAGGLRLGVRVR